MGVNELLLTYQVIKPRKTFHVIKRHSIGLTRLLSIIKAIIFICKPRVFYYETRQSIITIGKFNFLNFYNASYRKIDVENIRPTLASQENLQDFFILDDYLRVIVPFQSIGSALLNFLNFGEQKQNRRKLKIKKKVIKAFLLDKSIKQEEQLGNFDSKDIYEMIFKILVNLNYNCILSTIDIYEIYNMMNDDSCKMTIIQTVYDC